MRKRIKQPGPLRHVLVLAGLLCAGGAHADLPPSMQNAQRTEIKFPPAMRDHFLANMRNHLAAVSEIQAALGDGNFELAAKTATERLGMTAQSSMACNPAMAHMGGMAQYMPDAMREAGRTMHHAADRFAVDAKARDYRAAIASLSKVTQACVACHAQYRVR
ncbi:MAG TPA: hypothetical protein VKC56_10860 [Gallionellaceae bacterium]|nr:hypothetical protein [Gallionellaceae bacterium]